MRVLDLGNPLFYGRPYLQSSISMYTLFVSSKHRLNLTKNLSLTCLWILISVRIFCRARSFSSVDFATTFAAKLSPKSLGQSARRRARLAHARDV